MIDNHWLSIRKIHLDPVNGAPFWVNRARQLNIDVFKEVNSRNDFWKLGYLDLDTVRSAPVDDFLPQNHTEAKMPFESAGTAGDPVITYFSEDEFSQAFVEPFIRVVEQGLFPKTGPWLYLGPSGPHAVGNAAVLCSMYSYNQRPFMIDFDPRWAKKLVAGSIPATRYLAHLCEQALHVMNKVKIKILFVTPPVLDALCENVSPDKRNQIEGIQLAGMSAENKQWQTWQQAFPNAKFLIGYGNSLVGAFYPDINKQGYHINSKRVLIDLVKIDKKIDLKQKITDNSYGQVVVHRLDKTILYLNLCERDQAKKHHLNNQIYLDNVSPLPTIKNIKKGFY